MATRSQAAKLKGPVTEVLGEDDVSHQATANPDTEMGDPIGEEAMGRNRGDPSNSSSQQDFDLPTREALQQLSARDPERYLQYVFQLQENAKRERQAEQERQAQREAAEREAAERQAEQERQAQREAAEREAAERQAQREAAERQAEREYQLQLKRLEMGSLDSQRSGSRDPSPFRPRMENFPALDPEGDLDAFLQVFEQTCCQYQIPELEWARYLIPGLKGKALQALSALPKEQRADYAVIKAALIKKYNLTPEMYRQKFRTLSRGPTDSFVDLRDGQKAALRQWIRGQSITEFDDLEDMILKEQFLDMCPGDVRRFIVDRRIKGSAEAAEVADEYVANRKLDLRKPETSGRMGKPNIKHDNPSPLAARPPRGSTIPSSSKFAAETRRCFICHKLGHLSVACPDKRKNLPSSKPTPPAPAVLLVKGGSGKIDHNLQTVTVGNTVTVGMRDSGAELTLIRPELVSPTDIIPGKTMTVSGVGGISSALPMACVYLDWGAGSGVKEVVLSDDLPVNVVLGKDLGKLVSRYEEPDPPEPSENRNVKNNDVDVVKIIMCDPVSISDASDGGSSGESHAVCPPLGLTDPIRYDSTTNQCEPAELGDTPPQCDITESLQGPPVVGDVTKCGDDVSCTPAEPVPCTTGCDKAGGGGPMTNAGTGICQSGAGVSPKDLANILVVTRSQSSQNAGVSLRLGPSSSQPTGASGAGDDPGLVPGKLSEVTTLTSLLATPSQEFQAAVHADATLGVLRDLAGKPLPESDKERFFWEQGRLYRETNPGDPQLKWRKEKQLVVPYQFRQELLRVAHEIPLAGHLGVNKTKGRLAHHFYWPKMGADIANYCRSCMTCQRMGKSGPGPKAPLIPLPIIEEPFQRVAVDLIGPLAVPSRSGKRYILTVVDYATRYPEAVALSSIRTEKVADALLSIFSRVGFPKEMLTDQGPQFMSSLMQCLCKKTEVRHLVASPYHPQTNGLCERFNGTLKQMLKMLVESHGRDWERYLPHLLFAYREVPQASTGFSPFELLYGRRVRGPLTLVKESWEEETDASGTSVVDYVLKLRDQMQTLTQLVRVNMEQAQASQKQWYDRNARERVYEVGQKVWVLVPLTQHKLQAAWEGPFHVHQRLNDVNYVVTVDHVRKKNKVFHVNMMKAHHEREACAMPVCSRPEEGEEEVLIDLLATAQAGGSIEDAQINPCLSRDQHSQLEEALIPFLSSFTGKPGRTQMAVHHVDTGDHSPVRQSAYRVSQEVQADMKREIDEMLHLGVIQKSRSAWASPVVLVPKKDRTTRFCVDYRRLNAITVSDAYPMPRIDELLDRLAGAQYLTIMDLSRGYWQIPMTREAQERSAFITPFGLYESKVMPFGMKNAPATFQRLVNRLLEGLEGCAVAYLDDIAIFSPTWKDHLQHLSQVLRRIRDAGLTIKPGKCQIGLKEVQYLGHRVGGGH
ncbi:uncharacterized protein [Eleutherodactylus coqui]|uniref:uncharacterized protein n=1 Tax=Eleutherodactylus coqui TaxID=57060 RepID=UPI0034619247